MTEIYLVTGAAGFIGYYLSKKLLNEGKTVIGVDNLNDYYDVNLKKQRLDLLLNDKNFTFYEIDISNKIDLERIFETNIIDYVINLAAQAGVRYSIDNPDAYINSNIIGFHNILELCRCYPVKHLVYASSSSVYGNSSKTPFEETDFVDNPVSLYAATKKSNELMASTYSHLYNIPSTGLRFFTVYGPMGRPDMAYFSFVNKYFEGESIKIYNNKDFKKDLLRDFTYIDDIIEGIYKVIYIPPIELNRKHRILNIGNDKPIELMHFIQILEEELSKIYNWNIKFAKEFVGVKMGDVKQTHASIQKINELTGFKPLTSIREGLRLFCQWYKDEYKK